MSAGRSRGELVISMTLAETFLLLVFMVWYTTRPRLRQPPPKTEDLQAENLRLKNELQRAETQLAELKRNLDWWQRKFNQPIPGSEEEFKKFLFEVGRGKQKCQDDNVLVEVSVVNKSTGVKILATCPRLRNSLSAENIEFLPGVSLSDSAQIEALLREVQRYRKDASSDGECRFDYRLIYGTYEDYFIGRDRFERYFYSAGLPKKAANRE